MKTNPTRSLPPPFNLKRLPAALIGLTLFAPNAWAGDAAEPAPVVPTIVVNGAAVGTLGVADSASVGTITHKQLEARTVYRPAELLETTPGLIVSQHSGEGKANQFYLRGFNLDHGTDLHTTVDEMPVNQRSHAHGQGWTDLNFLMPELAVRMEYKKGTYYASEGDFSAAGAVSVVYADKLDKGVASLGIGDGGYRRAVLADSPELAGGHLLYAIEAEHNNGPFEHPDNFRKVNGVLRYSSGTAGEGFNLTAMAYHATWDSTDQIPVRALQAGSVARFGAIDPSDGGASHRYSLSGGWHGPVGEGVARVNAYVIGNKLDLYSNFTYYLDDPVNGDQFEQPDRRVTSGVNASFRWASEWFGRQTELATGLQVQNDNIFNGLYNTALRQRLSTTREDHIVESSAGLYGEAIVHWTPALRSIVGLRADAYRFDVAGDSIINSGHSSASKVSPKLGLVFGPWSKTEYYFNIGRGFHSNDARGTTQSVDPKTGDPAERVTPLVRAQGVEVGLRTEIIPSLHTSLTAYRLDFDSELVFEGDAGSTAAGRPSRREGFELVNFYKLDNALTIDADLAFARARFRDADPVGRYIPGAVEGVASVAIAYDQGPYTSAVQFRYFGPRPLIEDDSVRSKSTATINARIGYRIDSRFRVELEGFNLTNRRDSAVDYYYTSRLQGEPAAGVDDIHFHPIEKRSFRLSLIGNF